VALDFPSSPTDGQVYGSYTYNSTRGAWLNTATSTRVVTTSDTAPSNPTNGDMWMYTVDGTCFIYYNDGTSGQWVEQSRTVANPATYQSPNYIINGAFDYWQRGTASIAASLAAYTADRWLANLSDVNGARDVSQQSFTAGELSGAYNTYYLRHTVSAGGAATTYCRMEQRIEDVRTLSGQPVTVSFYAKAQTAGMKVAVGFNQNFGSGGSPSSEVNTYAGQVTLTTSWARYSVTVTLPSISGKTIGTGINTSYLALLLWQSAGANFASQTGTLGTQTGYVDYWGVQVEAGTVTTPFRRNAPSIQAELAACQRYYEKSYNVNDAPGFITESGMVSWRATNTATATQVNAQTTKYQVSKRIYNGTVRTYSPYTGTIDKMWNNSADVTSVVWAGGMNSVGAYFSASTVANAAIGYHWICDAEL
jgi:hypothetical protein